MIKQNLSVSMFFKGIEVSGKTKCKDGPILYGHGNKEEGMCASVHVCNGEQAVGGTHAGLEILGSGC